MSQFGMQMPGAQVKRGASMNIYTVLLLGALIMLGAATAFVYLQGAKIGPDGNALGLHESPKAVKLAN